MATLRNLPILSIQSNTDPCPARPAAFRPPPCFRRLQCGRLGCIHGKSIASKSNMRSRVLAILITACTVAEAQRPSSAAGSPEHHSDIEITWHIFKPVELPAPEVEQLHVRAGFRIQKFAENVGNARILAIGPNGNVYVTRREEGDILMFRVGPGGLSAGQPLRVASRSGLHGIAFSKGKVYLASVHEIFKADVRPDGTFGPLDMIIHDLPDAGQHNTRTVQIGPDDMMYISVGSTCNECAEPNPENATILRASLDGKSRSIFASGLRDTVSWGWQPQTGELWGMDNGMDALGDNLQPEELNHIEKGKRYGWPYLFGDNQPNPHLDPPGGLQKSELAKTNVPMALGYTAHAAPMQMSFYNASQFPAEYQGDAFVSMRGSWNRKPPSGYEVVRIHFKNGQPVSIEPFVTGFVTPEGEYGRLVGNMVARDGSLLFTDDRNGVIYRVSYVGSAGHSQTQTISGESMLHQARTGAKSDLAANLSETASHASLSVSSTAFAQGGAIPALYSSYDQNASPPLRWTEGPKVRNPTRFWPRILMPVLHPYRWFIGSSGTFQARLRNCGKDSKVWTGWKIPWACAKARIRPPVASDTKGRVRRKVIRRITIISKFLHWTKCSIFARARTARIS